MPRAAASSPLTWASAQATPGTFDLDQLNRVVLDHASVELEAAARRRRRTPLRQFLAKAMYPVAIAGILAPLFAVAAVAAPGEPAFEILGVYGGSLLGCAAVLYLYVPWAQSSYRPWDPTASTLSVLIAIAGAFALALIYRGAADLISPLLLAIPICALLLVAVATLLARYRIHSDEMPPRVNVAELSSEEMAILLRSRRQALTLLSDRGIVSGEDVEALDKSPLPPVGEGD